MPDKTRLGEVPADWRTLRLRDGADVSSGSSPEYFDSGAYAVIGSNGPIGRTNGANIEHGIAVGRVGASGSVHWLREPVWLSDNVLSVQANGVWSERFLFHVLVNARLPLLAVKTAQPLLTQTELGSIVLPAPAHAEQIRIAEVLDSIDAAIEKTEAVIAATERLRSALLGELLTRGVPGWHTEWRTVSGIGTIPACWDVVRLGDVLSAVDYGTNVPGSDSAEAIPVLGMKNMGDGEVRDGDIGRAVLPDDERTALLLRRGDILFNRTNSIDLVGKVAIVRDVSGDLSFASYLLRLRTDPGRADPWWLIGFLNHRPTQNALRRMATKGASQANINPTSLRSLVLPLPPVLEQKEVARLLETVRARAIQEGEQLGEMGELKGAAASALLSGRLRVPVDGGVTR